MLKAYKYRIYPNTPQREFIEKHFGCCRLLYNLALEVKISAWNSVAHKNISRFELGAEVKLLRKEFDWMKEITCESQHYVLLNLDRAYTNFFKTHKGFPKYKSKRGQQSFQLSKNIEVDFNKKKLFLPKLKDGIKTIFHRKFKGKIKTTTISRTPAGKYFVSILVDNNLPLPEKKIIFPNTSIGIDVGLNHFAILSDGTKIENPTFLRKSEHKLKWMSKKLSRKQKGSNRFRRYVNRVAKQYAKIANQRSNFIHNLSAQLTDKYDTISMEKLNIKGMSRKNKKVQDKKGKYLPNRQSQKRGMNKSINDAGWGTFATQTEYKSKWKGKNFIQIGTFERSTKECNICGAINNMLTLKDREWICTGCGTLHDRDENAAKVIDKKGISKLKGIVYLPSGRGDGSKLRLTKLVVQSINEASKNENSLCQITDTG